ncbi:MmcQ/YjbR family DNA-binding protein [Vitreimonas flagellata]|uniref:MmcQ/YjbR family DNA-binding protein n=1 Tax=Vitreimonas flagellata TaxID=2560861 RepID=UPI001074DA25|nr:MmcQ/YjbR family DNA-binding protein [Vitreimonas flagellata]
MAITKARARKLALALEGASEVVHVDRPAFRTTRKIFATVPPDAQAVNLMFDVATQEFFCEQAPDMFSVMGGGWGRKGITVCDLKAADEATFLSALKAAHALAKPAPKKAKRTAKRS